MKINWTMFGAGLTGGSFNVIETADRLAGRGHEVFITSIGTRGDLAWFESRRKPLFKYIFSPLAGSFPYRLYRRLLRRTILHPFPDVEIKDLIRVMPECDVNIATADPTTYAVHRSGKGKGLYYVQHYDSLFVPRSAGLRHDESYYLPLKKIAVSTWLKDVVEKHLRVSFAGVITAGIDEKIFNPDAGKRDKGKIRIISLGRNVGWKGFAELRAAIKIIFKKHNNVEWWVYSSRDTPASTPDAPFRVFTSPYGKDLARLYASCDIAVNPSWHEGFAQPALEAMACGAAVITTPRGAEDFIKPEKNCIVIEPKNSALLAQALECLITNQDVREKMQKEGFNESRAFHWDYIIDRWETMLTL